MTQFRPLLVRTAASKILLLASQRSNVLPRL
jgi:hypothetical protein